MEDVWSLIAEPLPAIEGEASPDEVQALRRAVHQTIKKVSEDLGSCEEGGKPYGESFYICYSHSAEDIEYTPQAIRETMEIVRQQSP